MPRTIVPSSVFGGGSSCCLESSVSERNHRHVETSPFATRARRRDQSLSSRSQVAPQSPRILRLLLVATIEHSPVADLSLDLTSPTRAYDRLGQRIFIGTDSTVDCSADLVGIPTSVTTTGNERWLAVFVRFARQLSDPRTDGNAQQVYFRRDESYELVVRQAPEAALGAAPKVALQADELLLCDVHLVAGQTQIRGSDIDLSRRQAFIFAQGDAVRPAMTSHHFSRAFARTH